MTETDALPSDVLASLTARLRAAGCVFAEEEAALLLAEPWSAKAREAAIARRVAGEPLETVLGWVEFDGLRLAVGPGCFVPRRRTELLVALAAPLLAPRMLVVELCCGVAPVAAALAHRVPGLRLAAADLDPVPLDYARRNLPSDALVVAGDLAGPLPEAWRGSVDVIVANAPYVPSDEVRLMPQEAREHEPRATLDGGVDGVELHRRVAAAAAEWLRPGGALLIETSGRQVALTVAACEAAGFAAEAVEDEEREAWAVVARLGA